MENKRTETNKTVQKRLEPELKLINMDTVEVEQIEWLLYPFIPYGKVTIIQGDPGEGKTTMVLQIIAKLTRGETILPADSTKDKRIDIDSESDMVDAAVMLKTMRQHSILDKALSKCNRHQTLQKMVLRYDKNQDYLLAGADCTKVSGYR
ncbi:MAG: AAA family ATPase [Blautia massiliensis (ex Durand et al. 2017)]